MATADRDRAGAELEVTRRQSGAELAQAQRELRVALGRVNRDRDLLALADRVVNGSLTAFAEGAAALPGVLEAQRSARDALANTWTIWRPQTWQRRPFASSSLALHRNDSPCSRVARAAGRSRIERVWSE